MEFGRIATGCRRSARPGRRPAAWLRGLATQKGEVRFYRRPGGWRGTGGRGGGGLVRGFVNAEGNAVSNVSNGGLDMIRMFS